MKLYLKEVVYGDVIAQKASGVSSHYIQRIQYHYIGYIKKAIEVQVKLSASNQVIILTLSGPLYIMIIISLRGHSIWSGNKLKRTT